MEFFMCVWSAYTGKKAAAPILFESLKKIEGFWSGFYTGLVTCSDGKFQMGKVLGNIDCWREKYDTADFAGTCGLIHSRTNSGGDERWSHPFIGSSGKVAVISQGCSGIFKNTSDILFDEWGNEMVKNGKVFSSSIYGLPKRYPQLADGGQVHCAEVFAQALEYYYEQLGEPLEAMKKVFSVLALEDVTLALFADLPGVIGYANVNQHIVCRRDEDGVYLSTTALGLPDGCGTELPCNSMGLITPESMHIEFFDSLPLTEMELPENMLKDSYEYIRSNPGCLLSSVVDNVLKPQLQPGVLNYRVGAAYRILETLLKENMIIFKTDSVTGAMGMPGTVFRLYAKKCSE